MVFQELGGDAECPGACGGPFADSETLDPEKARTREKRGCDWPCKITQRTPYMSCSECAGVGTAVVQGLFLECARCSGSGRVYLRRCANHYYEPWMHDFFEAMGLLEFGIMPEPGGWLDQTWDFVDFNRTVRSQRAECTNRKSESAGAAAEARKKGIKQKQERNQ